MRTEDGSENWEIQYLPRSWLNDVVFTDDTTGWVVGDYGFIWYTEDSGNTWTRIKSGTHTDLNRIVFMENGDVGYIFDEDNTLLKYNRTVGVGNGNNFTTPSELKLYQNYPNPFNPSTSIEFMLSSKRRTTLKVYNILGKEVVTLLDKELREGSHRAVWNGKDKKGKEVQVFCFFVCFNHCFIFANR